MIKEYIEFLIIFKQLADMDIWPSTYNAVTEKEI